MLNPNDRNLYLSVLTPPAGYEFEAGVATTFSLDLLTLLLAPVSFALSEFQNESDTTMDLTTILESLRRTADKLAVFCQSGRIQIPKADNLLYSYLEQAVVEVEPPDKKGVFHPKVWLLRFTAPGKAPFYRFICLSRNLTFDQSWDTMLVMEGTVEQRRSKGFSVNSPLTRFIRTLPELAVAGTSAHIAELIIAISADLPRVRFHPPPPFHAYAFRPMGVPGYRKLRMNPADRLLIMSPFLSDRVLLHLTDLSHKGQNTLISRVDSLDALQRQTIDRFSSVLSFDDVAVEPDWADDTTPEREKSPQGLHAKLILAEFGGNARLWTGSANATDPAIRTGRNVEFMVELEGSRKDIGIDRLLQEWEDGLLSLLIPYTPPPEPVKEKAVMQRLEQRLDGARRSLGRSGLHLIARPLEEGVYTLTVSSKGELSPLKGIEARCWPITVKKDTKAKEVTAGIGEGVVFDSLALESLTSFMAFELTAQEQGHSLTIRFVLNLPLSGMPENRKEHILYKIISDRGSFIRYLLMLLTEGGSFQPELYRELVEQDRGRSSRGGFDELPLFEELVRALSRQPEKIDRIARLVADISKTEEGRRSLPEGFAKIWEPIAKAREKVNQRD